MVYEEFFNVATGFPPFPFQSAFHYRDRSYSTCTLSAPTGLGKTETVAVDWLHGILYDRINTPTRLIIMLPMRSLTHQTASRIQGLLENLKNAQINPGISIHTLVGGTGFSPDRTWLNNIDLPSILVGTQDQILSRQLFRGYGCSRWEWPIHGALLNNDIRIVADETQLMGVGYTTTVLLQMLRKKCETYGPSELILCSATLDLRPLTTAKLEYTQHTIGPDDYIHPVASRKLCMKKVLHKLQISQIKISSKVIEEHIPNTLSLVIVNKVDMAISITADIQGILPVFILHSRFRGADRSILTTKLQGFTGVVIATQVIEAGIDLDARKLFTVACPWASFVQRCGRAGRNGSYKECDIYLLDIEEIRSAVKPLPYRATEIKDFYSRADKLISAGIGDLMAVDSPPQNNGRHHLNSGILKGLFDNYPSNSGDNVAHFIREDIDIGIKLLWRDDVMSNVPIDPPSELEAVNLRISKASKFLTNINYWVWDNRSETWMDNTNKPSDESYVCCDRLSGGYSEFLGFTGDAKDIPTTINLTSKSKNVTQWPKSQNVTLTIHSTDSKEFAGQICCHLSHILNDESTDLVIRASHLHDWGKAHPQFQTACNAPGEIWAKRNGGMNRYSRPGFRHELASAIALILHDPQASIDLAYLISAHHGKCRMQITNFDFIPGQIGLRGIKTGDILPSVNLGNGEVIPSVIMEELSPSEWKQEVEIVLDDRGAFQLSFLETIVRIADWRASARRVLKSY